MSTPRLRFLVAPLLALPCSAQTTWFVDAQATPPGNGSPASPYASIQYAISSPTTVAGDTLLVAPGTYSENLWIDKAVHVLAASGPLVTRVVPTNSNDIVSIGAGVVFEGFRVTGLLPGAWAAVFVGPNGTVRRCLVHGNTNGLGAGLSIGWGPSRVEQCTIVGNRYGITNEHFGGMAAIVESIVAFNSVENISPGVYGTPAYCSVGGDPGLWDFAEGEFRLRPDSPCIDAGDPSSPLDPDGTLRDIGALAYDASYAPGPVVFCTAKTNSQGCTPAIQFTGHATATGSAPFVVSATNEVPGKVGLLFYGPGKRFQPFQGGLHCVQLPTKRVGVQAAGGLGPCSGTYSFDFGAYLAAGSHPLLYPGALIACQWWSRDPLDPSGFGTGLSDALYFGVAAQ
jgi:hypothetical protein